MVGRAVRWGAVVGAGAAWWWAVLRIALNDGSGLLEGLIAAGGWGLGVLPVHCVPKGRAVGALAAGRWSEAWRVGSLAGAREAGAGVETGERAADASRSARPGGDSDAF